MKPTKQKHGKENLIGKIIYAFLMFIPLIAIGVTCLYVIFNKNAYQSYAGETLNESDYEKIQVNDLQIGKEYFIITPTNQTYERQADNTQFVVSNVSINDISKDVNQIRFYVNTNSTTLTIQGIGNEGFIYQSNQTQTLKFTFNGANNNNYTNEINTILYQKNYVLSTYVSEAFYYSIDQLEENPLFNWSSNTATYSVLQTTCTTLGITPQFIPMLLSYWLMMSLMYLLYDIALLIVHMAHNRIHDIESSI